MTILTSTKTDLKNRTINLPVVGEKSFDKNGQLLIEDDKQAEELIFWTAGSIDLVDVESIKSKSESDELGGADDSGESLTAEKLIEKINTVNFKELKALAANITKGVEGIKYSDWGHKKKEDLQAYLIDLITPEEEEEVEEETEQSGTESTEGEKSEVK